MLKTILKSWGREEVIYNGEYGCKLLIYTRPGIASSLHYHEKKTETFLITSGLFMIEVGKGSAPQQFEPGDSITLPPGVAHRVQVCQTRCAGRGLDSR